jgi:hypothetical protein
MDLISLLNILFLVIYAGILGLVAPYVGVKSEHYGSYVPTALAVTSGSILWILLTWIGMHYDEAWIWLIVMLGMPAAMWFGGKLIEKRRKEGKTSKRSSKAKSDSAADDIVILSS